MKKRTRLASLLVAIVMLFSVCAGTLVSCAPPSEPCETCTDGNGDGKCDVCNSPVQTKPGTKVQYTVSVNTEAGMPLSDVTVYVFKGEDDIEGFADTDENGIATIKLLPSDDYWFALDDVPDGYNVSDKYEFNGRSRSVVLASELIKDNQIPSIYEIGDIFHDMTLTLDNGDVVTLSNILGTGAGKKKAIVLNFWYTTCSWCIEEFPILNSLAEKYGDSVATFALNTYGEDMAAVKSFKDNFKFKYSAEEDLTLDMAVAPSSLFSAFGTGGYPTTVVIDRYGTICLLVEGAITSETQFEKIYTYFSDANYKQTLFETTEEFFPKEKPEDVEMPSYNDISYAILAPDNAISDAIMDFRPETESSDAEYSWPFILDENSNYIMPSNSKHESSFATLNVDLSLQKGQVFGFDYWLSTEAGSDIFYVLVDGVVIYSVSGDSSLDADAEDGWKKCYPIVAEKTGDYTVTFIYNKDGDTNYEEDTVRIDNLRVLDSAEDIDVETFLIKDAATEPLVIGYGKYAAIVYNEADGYYHVCVNDHTHGTDCDKNGPILLANLMNIALPTQDMDNSIYTWAYNGELVYNSENLYDKIVLYCSYASNGTLGTMCPVTLELADLLAKTFEIKGFSADDGNLEWLQFCKYFMPYGTTSQFADPVKGLAPFSAYETVLNDGNETEEFPNHVTYDRVIMPRGLWFAFTPEESGIYRITSNSKTGEVDGWIFTADREELYVYDHVERFDYISYDKEVNGTDYYNSYLTNVSMIMYFEAGETYYIDIAYYDVYAVGTIDFKVEKMEEGYEIFRSLSPGVFTYNLETNKIIAGGVQVALGTDGYYYVAQTDADGKYLLDENKKLIPDTTKPVYLDLTRPTSIFGQAIYADPSSVKDGQVLRSLISMGAFDFTKTEIDREGLTHLIDYAAIALCEFAKLSDTALEAKFANCDVLDELKVLRDEIAANVAAWDLTAMKSFINNSSFDMLVDFLKKNKDGAGSAKTALEAILSAYDTALEAYAEAKTAYENDATAANKAAFDTATAALEEKEAAISSYIKDTLLTSDALIRAFFKQNRQSNATTYVDNYTIKEIEKKYLKTDSADADRYPDALSDFGGGTNAVLCEYIESEVDTALRGAFSSSEEYESFVAIYRIEDLKNGIFHGKAGATDMTSDMLEYVDIMITEDTYENGCVKVDATLAAMLQQLMDYYTFANVENSWVKLCYYWQSFEA